jgi:hypothetical protein
MVLQHVRKLYLMADVYADFWQYGGKENRKGLSIYYRIQLLIIEIKLILV